jgi:uncharacterized protein (TIGR02588 family)
MGARRRKAATVPTLEWIAGGLALLFVAGTLAFLGFEAFQGEGQGPDLRVEIGAITQGNGGHSVAVLLRNLGRVAAAGVIVEGMSRDEQGREIRVEARLDYVPGLSEEQATLIFPFPPDRASLHVRVVSFTTP